MVQDIVAVLGLLVGIVGLVLKFRADLKTKAANAEVQKTEQKRGSAVGKVKQAQQFIGALKLRVDSEKEEKAELARQNEHLCELYRAEQRRRVAAEAKVQELKGQVKGQIEAMKAGRKMTVTGLVLLGSPPLQAKDDLPSLKILNTDSNEEKEREEMMDDRAINM